MWIRDTQHRGQRTSWSKTCPICKLYDKIPFFSYQVVKRIIVKETRDEWKDKWLNKHHGIKRTTLSWPFPEYIYNEKTGDLHHPPQDRSIGHIHITRHTSWREMNQLWYFTHRQTHPFEVKTNFFTILNYSKKYNIHLAYKHIFTLHYILIYTIYILIMYKLCIHVNNY